MANTQRDAAALAWLRALTPVVGATISGSKRPDGSSSAGSSWGGELSGDGFWSAASPAAPALKAHSAF